MIQVIYKRHKVGEVLARGYENVAYFPTWKAAMILMARWNTIHWKFEIVQAQQVFEDSSRWHPDVLQYKHLWENKEPWETAD